MKSMPAGHCASMHLIKSKIMSHEKKKNVLNSNILYVIPVLDSATTQDLSSDVVTINASSGDQTKLHISIGTSVPSRLICGLCCRDL